MRKTLLVLGIGITFSTFIFANTPWQIDSIYNEGDIVTYDGNLYISTYPTSGYIPEKNHKSWDGWLYIDSGNIPLFKSEVAYSASKVVNDKGHYYVSKWQVQGQRPNESKAWRQLVNIETFDAEMSSIDPAPIRDGDPKSPQAIHGIDRNNDGIRDSYIEAVTNHYSSQKIIQLALSAAHEYRLLHELAFDDSIQLSVEEAAKKLNSIIALEECVELLRRDGQLTETPLDLYIDSLYSALYYRIGKRRLFEAMGSDYEAFIFEDTPCPASFSLGGQQ